MNWLKSENKSQLPTPKGRGFPWRVTHESYILPLHTPHQATVGHIESQRLQQKTSPMGNRLKQGIGRGETAFLQPCKSLNKGGGGQTLSRKQELQPLITGQLPCETPEGRASASTTRRKSVEAHELQPWEDVTLVIYGSLYLPDLMRYIPEKNGY